METCKCKVLSIRLLSIATWRLLCLKLIFRNVGMFPQLDYQKKFVEKKYKFGKDNKQRRKRKSNGDRNSEPTSDSNKVVQLFLVQLKL